MTDSEEREQKITAVDEAGARPPLADEGDALIGQLFSQKYRVLTKLGRGGMSSVYKAIDVVLNRVVALKILLPSLMLDMNGILRFQQEARSASHLNNPHIIKIYEFAVPKEGGTPFLVMDYIDGMTLSALIALEGAIDVDRCIAIFMQTCDGLMHAHDNGVIHRDLKPSNLMITKSSFGDDFVHIVDFGIAKMLMDEDSAQLHLTMTGEVFGSPYYMSPEQCRGEKLDGRSDIYALGCVMYESLTGRPPFKANNAFQTMQKHISVLPEPFAEVAPNAEIPQALESIVLKSLAKSPSDRYQSMHDLYDDLKILAAERAFERHSTGSHAQRLSGTNVQLRSSSSDLQNSSARAQQTQPPAQSLVRIETGDAAALKQDDGEQILPGAGASLAHSNSSAGAPPPTSPIGSRSGFSSGNLIAGGVAVVIVLAVGGYSFMQSDAGSRALAGYLAKSGASVEKLDSTGQWMESRKQLQPAAICYLAAAQASAQAETIKSELRKTVDLLVQLSGAATNGGFENTLDSVVLATSPATSNQLASLADLAVAQISAKHYAAGEVSCRLAIALMVASPPLKTSPSEQTHRLLSALQDCYINQGRFRDMYATFGAIAESTSAMSDKEPLAFCYWSQATAKYELKDYGAAAPFYSKAISTLQHSGRGGSEEFAAMRYDQGQNFFKLNQLEDAERSFEDALAICTNLGLKEKQDSIRALLAQLRGEPEAPAPPTAHSEHEHMARPERAQHAAARSRFAKSHAGPEKHGLRGIFSKAKHLLGF